MPNRKRILQSRTFIAAITYMLLAFTIGILGNSAYAFFVLIWNQISTSIKASAWPWFIILALLNGLVVIFYLLQRKRSRVLSQALTTANNLIQSDDTLLSLLAVSVPTKDHETETKRLLTE